MATLDRLACLETALAMNHSPFQPERSYPIERTLPVIICFNQMLTALCQIGSRVLYHPIYVWDTAIPYIYMYMKNSFQNTISANPKIEFAMQMPIVDIMYWIRNLHEYVHL